MSHKLSRHNLNHLTFSVWDITWWKWLASFLEKKSRRFWEPFGASFMEKKPQKRHIWVISRLKTEFIKSPIFGNWVSVIFEKKIQNTFQTIFLVDFFPKMTLAQFPKNSFSKIMILYSWKNSGFFFQIWRWLSSQNPSFWIFVGFFSKNDASSVPGFWIFSRIHR